MASTSYVKFTALLGSKDNTSALCYLLEIDQSRILLDCGFTYTDAAQLEPLRKIAPTIDVVLLTHADLEHLGGYAYAVANFGLDCPCYSTTPVHDMGLQLMQDVLRAKTDQTEYSELTLAQVNKAFDKITLLRYSQPYTLTGKCGGIVISAFAAGRTVGGTVWKIKKDNEDIVYAVDFNHRKESHLNGTVLLSTESLARPSLLITDSSNIMTEDPLPRKARDSKLIDTITERLASNANILIPTQTATRVLELAYTLDAHWKLHKLTFHLVFLSPQSTSTLVYAKSMLEWMSDSISQSFQTRDQPFDFRMLKCLSSMEELEYLVGPKVVLTTFPSLEYGLARDCLIHWSEIKDNCVLFVEKPEIGSLGYTLYQQYKENMGMTQLNMDIPLKVEKRVSLEGLELDEFLKESTAKEVESVKEMMDIDVESDSDEEKDVEVLYDIYVKKHATRKGFFKQSQVFRMYPVHEVRNRVDEYGEVLDLSMFSKFEQKVVEEEYINDDKIEEIVVLDQAGFKYISDDIILKLRCKVVYVDFEGRSDGQSIKNIIQQLAPRKILLIHGSKDTTETLSDFCKDSQEVTDDIITPTLQECISVSQATNLYQVVLTDSLVSSLRLTQLHEYKLSYVAGIIRTVPSENGTTLFLDPLPILKQKQRRTVSVGNIKLSELKRQLGFKGFKTQFAKGGVLVVNSRYLVRRSEEGAVSIEGKIGLDYYRLRDLLYGFQAMLS